MLKINLSNIEKLVFYDKKVKKLLPEFNIFFNQWALARRFFGFKSVGQKAVLDLLNSLTPTHKALLEQYFETSVTIDKLDYHLVKTTEFCVDDAEVNIQGTEGYENFSAYQDGNQVYLLFWR